MSTERERKDPFEDGAPLLSDAQAVYLDAYVRDAYDRFGLRDWQVRVSRREPQRDAMAATSIRENSTDAVIAFSREFLEAPAADQRESVAHEVLHPQFTRLTNYAIDMMDHEVGHTAERFFNATLRALEEQTIERLAIVVAVLLPLPEIPA